MPDILPAVVLAGGLARRMGGGDKPLRPFGEGTILSAVLARLGPQADPLAISANGDPARFAPFGLPVLPDPVEGHPGPLAGVLAAMLWARSLGVAAVLTVPGDAPFLPADLAPRLTGAGAPAFATAGGRAHPIAALWPTALAETLHRDLDGGLRKVEAFASAHQAHPVEFAVPPGGPDPFLNLNTPEDLLQAARWL